MVTNEKILQQAFVDALDVPADVDWESLAYRGIEQWDSVAHMRLVAEIEDVFDVMIETDDVIDMSSYPKVKTILTKYGVSCE
jgi:acyl carrier protein